LTGKRPTQMTPRSQTNRISRRGLLQSSAALATALALPKALLLGPDAYAAGKARQHGLSIFGTFKYEPDFAHFGYVNPAAPKGGVFSQVPSSWAFNQNPTTFNSLNTLVQRGDAAVGLLVIYDSLMVRALDEPDAMYGLVARDVSVSADGLVFTFALRPEARFHDGTPLTAADVEFTLTNLKTKGHALIRQGLREMAEARATGDHTLEVRFTENATRSLPQFVAGLPIVSRADFDTRDFEDSGMDVPLGSGPYKVGRLSAGRFIEYDRVEDYWARDLPCRVGQNNFGTIRYDFFRDRTAAFEGFKSGEYYFREEFTSRVWATEYNFPAIRDGKVVRETLPDDRPSGAQGWFLNTRRSKFSDPRVREALIMAYDFEWANQNLFYGLYKRTGSFFENSDMKAEGAPSPEELALLEPFRDQLAEEVFGEPFSPPVSDGSGQDRRLLRRANALLREAGCDIRDGVRYTADGQPFTIEFLGFQQTFDRVVQPYIRNLDRLGIQANFRIVDSSQYQSRMDGFDFDVATQRFVLSLTLGEEVARYWSSSDAATEGSQNLAGIADPVIDALIAKIMAAETRDEQVIAARAIDRVLRAGRYWVPHWYKSSHSIAFWDIYDRPETKPDYALGANQTWWYDSDKAVRIGLEG
jgi:microcin C transport system substrate-binding protein